MTQPPQIPNTYAVEQRSEEWFEARKGRITASLVGAILGSSPNMDKDAAMRSMVRDWHGAEREFKGNIATEWGVANESLALMTYGMDTGNHVDAVGFITKEDWAGCSPDGLISDTGGVEIKCPFGIRKGGQFKSLEDQPHYFDQVQFSLWVTGREFWDFYQWTPHGTAGETVRPSQEWQDEALPKLRQFYAEFLFERDNNKEEHLEPLRTVIDTPDAVRLMNSYLEVKEQISNAESFAKELLEEMVGLAGGKNARIAGRNLTLVKRAGSISYAKAIKELAPDADLEKWRGKGSESWQVK